MKKILASLLCIVLPCFHISVHASPTPEKVRHLRESIIALHRICTRASQDLSKARSKGGMTKREQDEYEIYISYLRGRIDRYCRELSTMGGQRAVEGLPCTGDGRGGRPFSYTRTPEVKTSEEQVEDLDHELITSLGEFDDMLLREKAALDKRGTGSGVRGPVSPNAGAGGRKEERTGEYAAGKPNKKGNVEKSEGEVRQGEEENHVTGKGGEGAEAEETGGHVAQGTRQGKSRGPVSSKGRGENSGVGKDGRGQGTGTARTARDRLYADDDIVARQLREAAEKETDPELKKKLWEEYRKYKEGK